MHEFKEEASWLRPRIKQAKSEGNIEDYKEMKRRLWIIKAVNREYCDLMLVLPVYENLRRLNIVSDHFDYPELRKSVKAEFEDE